MVEPQSVRTAVVNAGFIVEDFVEFTDLPTPMTVWKPFILSSATPVVRVPANDGDHDSRVDHEWWWMSTRNGTIGPSGMLLLSIEGAGRLPWLKVTAGVSLPRASEVGVPGMARGFVALSPDGQASTCVSNEEWETWILANPIPSGEAQP